MVMFVAALGLRLKILVCAVTALVSHQLMSNNHTQAIVYHVASRYPFPLRDTPVKPRA